MDPQLYFSFKRDDVLYTSKIFYLLGFVQLVQTYKKIT